MKNPDIDIIKNKFLEYIASLIEIKTREKVETEEKIECLNYTTSLLNLINKSKEFLIKYLKTNKNIQNKDYYELAIENAKDILKYSTKMKLHKF